MPRPEESSVIACDVVTAVSTATVCAAPIYHLWMLPEIVYAPRETATVVALTNASAAAVDGQTPYPMTGPPFENSLPHVDRFPDA